MAYLNELERVEQNLYALRMQVHMGNTHPVLITMYLEQAQRDIAAYRKQAKLALARESIWNF